MKKLMAIAAIAPMIAACTTSAVTLTDGGAMMMTYEAPGIEEDAKDAFKRVMKEMNAVCKSVGGEAVEFAVQKRPKKIPPGMSKPLLDLDFLETGFDIAKAIAGKTTVTLQGVCYKEIAAVSDG